MRPITPASRCRTAAPFQSIRQPKTAPPRHVTVQAHVDASMSKPKLLKLKKTELVEACQLKGVATTGTKEQLASNLLAFFATADSNTVAVAVAASAAASSADDVQLLTSRVAELDNAIQTRTEELQSLHDGDRAAMEKLLVEVAGVKGSWQGKLKEISAVLEDVVTLKKGQLEVSKLNQQQEELHEELKVLSRMLKLRETEIKSLETQLDQVREERATDKESVVAERLANVAVLALAGQVASGGSSYVPVQSLRSMYAAPSYIPSIPTGPAGPGTTPKHFNSVPDVTFNMPTYAPKPKQDVFGTALPGLVICGVLGFVHKVYTGARDSVLETQTGRTAADTCAAAGVLATMLLTHSV